LSGKFNLGTFIELKQSQLTCSFVISSVDMPSITTGVFAVFFLPFFPPFFPPFAFGGCSKQHSGHTRNNFIPYIIIIIIIANT